MPDQSAHARIARIVMDPKMTSDQKLAAIDAVGKASTKAVSAPKVDYPRLAVNNYGAATPGNIDLEHRPHVQNPDGSVSTVLSMGANVGGKEVLMPMVSPQGRIMSERQAIDEYRRTGKNLGTYDSVKASNEAAQAIHEDQERSPPEDTLNGAGSPLATVAKYQELRPGGPR